MRSAERRKVNALEMQCLRSLVGMSRMDRDRNEEVRRRIGIERELASRADQRVLRWFGHVERMNEMDGGRVRGRPRLGLMDGVKVALGNRGMTVEAARQCAKNRKERRALVHMYVTERVSRGHFCLALCSFGPATRALVVITWRGEGCSFMMRLG